MTEELLLSAATCAESFSGPKHKILMYQILQESQLIEMTEPWGLEFVTESLADAAMQKVICHAYCVYCAICIISCAVHKGKRVLLKSLIEMPSIGFSRDGNK